MIRTTFLPGLKNGFKKIYIISYYQCKCIMYFMLFYFFEFCHIDVCINILKFSNSKNIKNFFYCILMIIFVHIYTTQFFFKLISKFRHFDLTMFCLSVLFFNC